MPDIFGNVLHGDQVIMPYPSYSLKNSFFLFFSYDIFHALSCLLFYFYVLAERIDEFFFLFTLFFVEFIGSIAQLFYLFYAWKIFIYNIVLVFELVKCRKDFYDLLQMTLLIDEYPWQFS